jgi:hypothetical protein
VADVALGINEDAAHPVWRDADLQPHRLERTRPVLEADCESSLVLNAQLIQMVVQRVNARLERR